MSHSGLGGLLAPNGVGRAALGGVAFGLAEHAGYLAHVPRLATLSTEATIAIAAWAIRKYLRGPQLLDDVARVAATVAGVNFGRAGLSGVHGANNPNQMGYNVGADPFEVHGDDSGSPY